MEDNRPRLKGLHRIRDRPWSYLAVVVLFVSGIVCVAIATYRGVSLVPNRGYDRNAAILLVAGSALGWWRLPIERPWIPPPAGWRFLWFASFAVCIQLAYAIVGLGGVTAYGWIRFPELVRHSDLLIVAIWLVGMTAALVGSVFSLRVARRRIRVFEGRCEKCNYDLRGLPTPRCPECGTLATRMPGPPVESESAS